jgi:endoglucanase
VSAGLRIFSALCLVLVACGTGSGAPDQTPALYSPGVSKTVAFDGHLVVDQFGYRPGDPKVAVIRDPQEGYDSSSRFSPGSTYQVRRTSDGSAVFTGTPTPWRDGAVQPSSGDRGWWFDFSALSTPGSYFIYDGGRNVRSAAFNIDQQVYKNVLRAAVRMFYYQRSGMAKRRPYADPCWTDAASYGGPDQDTQAHDISDPDNKKKLRDVSGGWFDAGDTNKYVTFAAQPVHQLLTAYQQSPGAFTDDFNIPESGNGIPDLLDEVRWETDWLKKMQFADGSAALKVGEIVYAAAAPPSSDHHTRYYIPGCSSSTIAVAGMFAHAAQVFGRLPALAGESADLAARATAAWNNYQAIRSKQAHCDTGVVHAGNADWSEDDQRAAAVVAAIYLFAVTGNSSYDSYVQAHFRELQPYHDFGWSRYKPEQGEALLFYTTLPRADPALRRTLLADKLNDVRAGNQVYGFHPDDDLYRSFLGEAQYHWGSNNPRAAYGNTNMDVITYGIDPANEATYSQRAVEVLHYFHGVNPFAMVYLSNMYAYGATQSANEIYHTWFARDTRWSNARSSECGPAPGYVPGGPNAQAVKDGVPGSLRPPAGQPPQKSYKDWNKADPDKSWTVTEPAIYYQSGYVKLLSKFSQ